jgi:hypothetical protein
MNYNRETGEVIILDPNANVKKKKIITTHDEVVN